MFTSNDDKTNSGNHSSATMKESLENMAHQAGQHVHDLSNSAEHNIANARDAMTLKIRDNPVQSSLIALGVGLIAGMLYRR